jgi:hypothetical protein
MAFDGVSRLAAKHFELCGKEMSKQILIFNPNQDVTKKNVEIFFIIYDPFRMFFVFKRLVNKSGKKKNEESIKEFPL